MYDLLHWHVTVQVMVTIKRGLGRSITGALSLPLQRPVVFFHFQVQIR